MKNSYGTWSVRTEGDVEGKTMRTLGTFTGYVDEIALYLADECYYSLTFRGVEDVKTFKASRDSVNITFDRDYGLEATKNFFKDRPVFIEKGNYYHSYVINSNDNKGTKRQLALDKLTDEDKELLGLK